MTSMSAHGPRYDPPSAATNAVPTGGVDAPVIQAAGLTKTYRFHQQRPGVLGALRGVVRRRYQSRLAVDRLDLMIGAGEVVGLLGPNGAGKTTTLKMLSGLLHPSAGRLEVLGHAPAARAASYLRQIALVMGQKTMLTWEVPAIETLLLHKVIYALADDEFEHSVAELTELLDVGSLLQVPVRKVSLGERMRLELMVALLHGPRVLFLDEPTIGLDVVAKERVRGFLSEVNRRRGTTIIVTSHDMDDIEALCSRVMIVDQGRLAYDGGLTELVRATRPHKVVRATYAQPVDYGRVVDLRARCMVPSTDLDGQVLRLEVPRADVGEVLGLLPRLGDLVDVEVTEAAIDEIIRELFTTRTRANNPDSGTGAAT